MIRDNLDVCHGQFAMTLQHSQLSKSCTLLFNGDAPQNYIFIINKARCMKLQFTVRIVHENNILQLPLYAS